jgi:N-sulfoglucosamine sulfohydrolase
MRLLPLLLALALPSLQGQAAPHDTRPNIVLCMADDWGWPHASAYGDEGVQTPAFDRLAAEGVLFRHAYTTSPSCTPSRNAVLTGKYHWQLGPGANLWSTLPAEHESFVHLLRDAGYRTGRNRAKSWGPGNPKSWVEVHGDHPVTTPYATLEEFLDAGGEEPDAPFFFWLGTSDPHRDYEPGSGARAGIDPNKSHLFEHFPDVPEVRSDVADYYFEVQRWDSLVRTALEELERRGVLDNTIVLMTGDHGMPFPRGKGNLYDSGVRVPLALRWPAGVPSGRTLDDFVSFADFAPTLLELAGAPVPADMTGSSFAGLLRSSARGRVASNSRPFAVFGRERHTPAQEAPNMGGYPSRGLRTETHLYIRNYQPDWWPAGTGDQERTNLPNQWFADCDGGPTKDWIFEHREDDAEHARSFALCFGKRPAEELYAVGSDPDQVVNLAGDPGQAALLEELRARLHERLTQLDDPRAADPATLEFDQHPYLGGGGGKRKKGR